MMPTEEKATIRKRLIVKIAVALGTVLLIYFAVSDWNYQPIAEEKGFSSHQKQMEEMVEMVKRTEAMSMGKEGKRKLPETYTLKLPLSYRKYSKDGLIHVRHDPEYGLQLQWTQSYVIFENDAATYWLYSEIPQWEEYSVEVEGTKYLHWRYRDVLK